MTGKRPIIKPRSKIFFAAFTLLSVLFFSCDRTREDKGYEYFPDMVHGHAYQTYSDNPAMEDGRTMREPVEGTVPRHLVPYPYAADFEGREQAGQALKNPLTMSDKLLAEGRELYRVYCSNCHGESGDGQGNLHTSGAYIITPTSLLDPRVKEIPEGETYHVITAGWGVMGEHASLIQPEDRWKIVAFIEQVLQEK